MLMTSKTIIVISIICAIGALLIIPNTAEAHNGHCHGSACGSPDAKVPPTFGVDSAGKRIVSGGLKINDSIHDVEYFKQTIDTPVETYIGQPIEISLKAYADEGLDSIEHVELNLGEHTELIGGIWVQTSPVTIEWNRTFDGIITTKVVDENNLIKNVSVHSIVQDKTLGFQFKFMPKLEIESTSIAAKIWTEEKGLAENHFYNALKIKSLEVTNNEKITRIPSNPIQKSIEPETIKNSPVVPSEEMQCKKDKVLLLRISNNIPVCVDEYQASVLIKYNWATHPQ